MADPRITVLGGNGFIGNHLLHHFQQRGLDCHAPVRGDESIFSEQLGHVIYAIGLTADFRVRPLDTVEAHVCLLNRLLASARFESLTYLSSTRVYADSSDTSETAYLRVNPNEAGDLYNLSKLMGESLCLHGERTNIKIARLSNIVGLRHDPDIFIDQLLEEGCAQGHIMLRTSLDSTKDYLYIDDAVEVLSAIALSSETGIFNVASGEGVKNGEIVRFLEQEMGFAVTVASDASVWNFTEIDISRIKALFKFSPRKFQDYFPRFLNLYRQKKGY